MKRASFQSRILITALIAALLLSVVPAAGASVSPRRGRRDSKAAQVTLARTAEVKVTAGPTVVLIEWHTSFELDNLGFNVIREQAGARTQVNPSIIAGSALIVGQGTPLYAGYTYRWFDAQGSLGDRYYLEDLDLKGEHTVTGPYSPVWNANPPKAQQAKLLSEVAAQASSTTQIGGPAGAFSPAVPTVADIQAQWAIAAQPGLKIGVRQDGWYRVTQPAMVAAGFNVSADAGNLRLFVDGAEVSIEVSRSSGSLGANDFIEFYGTALDTPTTDTHVYYLTNGAQAGLRVPVSGSLRTDLAPGASSRPSPVPSLTVGTSESFVAGGWWGDISSGIVAEGEKPKPQTIERAGQRSESPVIPQTRDTGAWQPIESDKQPAYDLVKTANAAAASLADSANPVAVKSPALSGPKPTTRFRVRSHRRRVTRRPSHRALKPTRNHALAAASSTAGFLYDVQLKERFVYFSGLRNGPAENFFGTPITPSLTKTLNAANLQSDSQGTAQLRIGLQGASNHPHAVDVLLNGSPLGTISFDPLVYAEQSFSIGVSQLREGSNDITFVKTGTSGDLVLYSYARLTYPRTYRAENDILGFLLRSTQSATIDGFTTANIRVLDISNPTSVQEVRPMVQPSGAGYAATVPSSPALTKGSRRLLALPSASFLQPASLLFNQPSMLNQSSSANPANAADLLIIAHKSFLSLASLATLVAQRQAQGFTVKVLDVEDLYDEFSYGAHTPQAITDFLARARTNWTQAPRYLLLVGSATYDPRNYSGGAKADLVPTKLVDTVYLEVGSDDSLTDFNDDGIAEIPVGRLPVTTAAEANLMLSKITNFSPGNVPQSAVMVADAQGSYFFNFEQANEDLIALLPAGMQSNVQKVYRAQQPSDASTRASIINTINSGAALVNYSGHGNVDVWTGAPIFSGSDALALTNGNKLPLVIVMDCLNGYFIAPSIDCLSESLLKAPNGGAVASFSSSGLTIPIGQHQMGQQLFQLLYSGSPMALGDATRQAKLATTDIDVRRTWILFGDPTMRIR
jgi:hypothetical protein